MLFISHLERKEQMLSGFIYLELIVCSAILSKYNSLWIDWQIINMIYSINVIIPHSLIFFYFVLVKQLASATSFYS